MRVFVSVFVCCVLATPALHAWLRPGAEPPVDKPPPPVHDGGASCGAGCSADPADGPELVAGEFLELLAVYADEPAAADRLALETLLFHGARVKVLAAELGTPGLDAVHRAFLERELARRNARLLVRMVDEAPHGTGERLLLDAVIPLDERRHLFPDRVVGVQPPEVTATIKRVGLRYLWARL
ncbi:MAG: hypothetical protein O7B99_04280 [Planctomycetota bacterium]|nr:hypothetical protein [Planctomycetota bacterium]